MNREALRAQWLEEEKQAHIKGCDFSHIHDRYREEDELPWDMRATVLKYLKPDMRLLDMETNGGEFLLSFGHPARRTAAIEAYPPNVAYCREKLLALGIDFKAADGEDVLPFADASFQMITNRHGAYRVTELKRLLTANGYFITQQIGAENDRELIQLLTPENTELPFPDAYPAVHEKKLRDTGFAILEKGEVFQPIRFYDVGALVWFARIIEWEFEGFSVETHLENLYKAQDTLEEKGVIEGTIHRFYFVAQKNG